MSTALSSIEKQTTRERVLPWSQSLHTDWSNTWKRQHFAALRLIADRDSCSGCHSQIRRSRARDTGDVGNLEPGHSNEHPVVGGIEERTGAARGRVDALKRVAVPVVAPELPGAWIHDHHAEIGVDACPGGEVRARAKIT